MRILKLLLVLGSIAGATSITSAVGGNPNPLLTTGDIWAGTTNGAPTNLPAGASGTFLGSNGIGIAPTYQLINYSSLTGTVPTWNQSTTGSAATLTTPRTIATSGDAVGTATSFNGSANISIPTTVVAVNGAAVPASKTIVGTNASSQIVDASAATLANNTTGSAAKWTTPRTLAWTSDATGSMSVDGSGNASTALTLATVNSNVGSYGAASTVPVVTVNAKGLVTAVSTATITPAAIGAASVASPTFTGTVTTPAFTLSGANTGLFTSTSGSMGVTSGATGTMLVGAGVGAVPTWSASPSVAGTLTSTDASALANGVVVGGNAGMGTAVASGSGAWFGPTGGNSITAGTENGVMAAPTYMDITSPGSIQAQAATTFSLAIGSVYSFIALSASTSGVTLNGTTTIGSGTGTAVLTSGVVSTLSGTNLVLGNGSTIPQSTFQPALSGGTTGALTKWTGSSTLGNAVANTDYLPVANPTATGTLTAPVIVGGLSDVRIADWAGSSGIGWIGQSNTYNSGSGTYSAGILFNGGLTAIEGSISQGVQINVNRSTVGLFNTTGVTITGNLFNTLGANLNSAGALGASAGTYGALVGAYSNMQSSSRGGLIVAMPSGYTGNPLQVDLAGSSTVFAVGSGGAITSNATGTAISAPNGNISAQGAASTGGEVIGGTAAIGTANYNSTYGWVGLSGKNGASNATDFGILFDATGSPNLNSSASSSGYILAAGIQEANWNTASFNFTEPVTFNGIVARQSYNRNTSATLGNVTVSALYSVISLEPGSSNPTTLTSIPNGTVDGQQLTLIQNAPATCVVSSSNLVATFSLTAGSSRNLTWNAANSKWL